MRLVCFIALLLTQTHCEEGSDDFSDSELIDDLIKSQNKSEPIASPSKSPDSLTPKSDLDQSNLNKTDVSCKCMKYYECHESDAKEKEDKTTPTPPAADGNSTNSGSGDSANPVSDILGIVDIRANINRCQHYFEVCCKVAKNVTIIPSNDTSTDVPTSAPTVLPTDAPTTRADVAEKPTESKEQVLGEMMKNITSNWSHKGCGHRNEHGIGFKITGQSNQESEFGEFPWMAAIIEEKPVELENPDGGPPIKQVRNVFLCGGALIHPSVVLTAAHCIFHLANSERRSRLKVRLGEWDTQTTDEPIPDQTIRVKDTDIHEQLYRKGLFNDVALLFLEKEAKLAPNVDTICLPKTTDASTLDHQKCLSSGWGKDKFGAEGRYQDIMKRVEITVVPRKPCEMAFRKTKLSDAFRLHESFMCAGGEGDKTDTCEGDGGSPLICKDAESGRYFQVGIVAWGVGCGPNLPAAYVNVPLLTPWIEKKMKARNYDLKYSDLSH